MNIKQQVDYTMCNTSHVGILAMQVKSTLRDQGSQRGRDKAVALFLTYGNAVVDAAIADYAFGNVY